MKILRTRVPDLMSYARPDMKPFPFRHCKFFSIRLERRYPA